MFAVAEVITNGSSAGRVIEVVSSSAAHRGGVARGQLEERYVWTAGHKRLQRELRRLDTSQSSL